MYKSYEINELGIYVGCFKDTEKKFAQYKPTVFIKKIAPLNPVNLNVDNRSLLRANLLENSIPWSQ